jgi:hypothetical protein
MFLFSDLEPLTVDEKTAQYTKEVFCFCQENCNQFPLCDQLLLAPDDIDHDAFVDDCPLLKELVYYQHILIF